MKYEGLIMRPPSEANSLLLQVTVGCSHNKCTFCTMYKTKKFRIKSPEEINSDIIEASKKYSYIEKIFLCDGDALIIPQNQLNSILINIKKYFKNVKRVGIYANAKSILEKNIKNLIELRNNGLGIIYLGIESGNDEILKKIHKGASKSALLKAGIMVKNAEIILSTTIILGIAGSKKSYEHAFDTAVLLSKINPEFVGALTLILPSGIKMAKNFEIPNKFEIINELAIIIANSNFTNCFFTSNHASNYLAIKAKLPYEKEKILNFIKNITKIKNSNILKPEFLRAL